jgi:hypothetical protein
VQEQLDHVGRLLQAKVAIYHIKKTRPLSISNPTTIQCFNDSINNMQKYLDEMETLWTPAEIKEFLEGSRLFANNNYSLITVFLFMHCSGKNNN